jgi:hypothetical protein
MSHGFLALTFSDMGSSNQPIEVRAFEEGDLVALQRHVPSGDHPCRAGLNAITVAPDHRARHRDEGDPGG